MKITMMRNKTFLAALLMCAFSNAFAVGMGLTLGNGTESWTSESAEDDNTVGRRHGGDRKISNFGLVLDTKIAKDGVFNYRLALVSEENTADVGGYNIDMKGIAMTHDFGFGIVRSRMLRLWVGPELKMAYYSDITPSHNTSEEFSGEVVGFGLGPAIGLNIHLPKVVSFSVSAAYYLATAYAGQYDATNSFSFVDTVDVEDSSKGLSFNACILFRFNDNY